MAKTLDFYKFVSSDRCRLFLTGVYYKDGIKWATNGCVALKIKESYPEKFEDKIVSKELTYIEGKFPNVQKVIPELSDMEEMTDVSPNDVLLKEFKALKSLFAIHRKISGNWDTFRYVLPNHSEILFKTWELVMHFLECYPDSKLYCHKEDDDGLRRKNEKSLMLISGDATFVFMPAIHSEDESKVGYVWKFDKFLWENNHEEFDFLRTLLHVGSKGIVERYQNGNLTDKDNKVIDDLYRYLEIVGYDYKREVA